MMGTVLIVEDDPMLRRGMSILVESYGHRVLPAATVAKALERLAERPTHALLDMNLPDGHGTAILRHVRETGQAVRVAVLSGSLDAGLMTEARSLNPDAVFRKPADLNALMGWIAG